MYEQPFSRTLFYVLGSLWFFTNVGQRAWQNQVHYSLLEEIRIMNKLKMDKRKNKELR